MSTTTTAPGTTTTTTISETQPVPDYSRFFHTLMNAHQHYPHVAMQQQQQARHHNNPHHRWRFFSASSTRSFWTKYCLLCTICGSAATILAGIFLVVAALFRYYTTSIYYFETVPTYIPAILLSICGVSTIAFSCKRNRNIILLRITACWSLVSAALSSVITITTSLIHMNRLQTLRECVYNGKPNPPSCTCIAHTLNIDSIHYEPVHYVFENTPDCDVIHGTLYSCLRAVFAISVVAVLLSIFLCMLLYQLIGHERKKAYWSRIRRINSDWSTDFIACLARPVPRERSSMLPLVMSPTTISLPVSVSGGPAMLPHQGLYGWGPPPPYEDLCLDDRSSGGVGGGGDLGMHLPAHTGGINFPTAAAARMNTPSSATFIAVPPPSQPPPPPPPGSNLMSSNNNNHNNLNIGSSPHGNSSKPREGSHPQHHHQHHHHPDFPIISAHPFSPTITSMETRLEHHHLSPNNNSNNNNLDSENNTANFSSNVQNSQNGSPNNSDESETQLLQIQMTPPEHCLHLIPTTTGRDDREKELDGGESSDITSALNRDRRSSDKHDESETMMILPSEGDMSIAMDIPLTPGKGRRISKNSRLQTKMRSLPNSPIMKNVRKFCSFRLLGDHSNNSSSSREDEEDAKIFNSAVKLNSANAILANMPGGELASHQGGFSDQNLMEGIGGFERRYSSSVRDGMSRKTCFTSTDEEIESL